MTADAGAEAAARVRVLTAADAIALRDVRLEALKSHPEVYASSFADSVRRPLSAYIRWIETSVIFGLFTVRGLEGILAYDREQGSNTCHRAGLDAVYVRKRMRGTGGAAMLLDAAVERARADGVVQLEIEVSEGNGVALDFYARHGFVRCGVTPRALLVEGRYLDELALIRRLDDR